MAHPNTWTDPSIIQLGMVNNFNLTKANVMAPKSIQYVPRNLHCNAKFNGKPKLSARTPSQVDWDMTV